MKNPLRGSLSLVLAAALYGSYGIFSRMIGQSFGVFSQNWIRPVLMAIFSMVLVVVLHVRLKPIKKRDSAWIIAWILCGAESYLTFIAFINLPLGTVYFLTYATMIIASYGVGTLLYKEKLSMSKVISLILAIVGLYLIYSFSIASGKIFFAILALISGGLTGLWNVLSKKFSHNYSELQLIMMDSVASAIIGFCIWLYVRDRIPAITQFAPWLWLLAFSCLGIGTVAFILFGFKNLEAQIGSIILPVEIVFAIIFGYLLFGETLSLASLIGGVFIGSAAILPSLVLAVTKRNRVDN